MAHLCKSQASFPIKGAKCQQYCLISTLSEIRVTKDNPGYVFFKKSHSDVELWQKIRVLKKNKSEDQIKNVHIVGQESTPELYAAKKQNSRAMIPYLHLPEHQEFYQKLTE